jgi:hypothetical protein
VFALPGGRVPEFNLPPSGMIARDNGERLAVGGQGRIFPFHFVARHFLAAGRVQQDEFSLL